MEISRNKYKHDALTTRVRREDLRNHTHTHTETHAHLEVAVDTRVDLAIHDEPRDFPLECTEKESILT